MGYTKPINFDFNNYVEEMKDNIVDETCKIIRIKSVSSKKSENMPFGEGVDQALEHALELGRKFGFKTKKIDNRCGYIEYGEGETYIGIITHADVVPEGENWTYNPFGGEIHNEKIYGRGAIDNKGPMIASIFALKAIKDSGLPLARRIRIIIGTDQETECTDMEYYLRSEKPPIAGFTPNGNFPVVFAEKGLAYLYINKKFEPSTYEERIEEIKGGCSINTVPGYCKAKLITLNTSEIIRKLEMYSRENSYRFNAELDEDGIVIESFGIETHSAGLEFGENAVQHLIGFLISIEFGNKEVKETLFVLHKYLMMDIYGKPLGIDYEDEFSGKLTVNVGEFNFDGESLCAGIDIRYPVTYDVENNFNKIKNFFQSYSIEISQYRNWNPVYFPKDHFLIQALTGAYEEVTGDRSKPIYIGGGTYSKSIPNVAAFGPVFPGEKETEHEANEFVKIKNLIRTTKIYALAAYNLASQ